MTSQREETTGSARDARDAREEMLSQPNPFGLPVPGSGPVKNNQLLYAAGDVVAWVGPPNVGAPQGFEDPTTISDSTYAFCGWVDTSGYIFKLDETIKDIPAAGILTPIRSILTGGTKSIQCVFLEALNPYVRALYDDVPVFPLETSPLNPPATPAAPLPANSAIYIIPDPPSDNRYSVIFDSIDGQKQQRLYAPYAKVTARGNDQAQQGDIVMTDLTFTLYPGTIGTVTGAVAQRTINYGQDISIYFGSGS
jgi:hypothetical protein